MCDGTHGYLLYGSALIERGSQNSQAARKGGNVKFSAGISAHQSRGSTPTDSEDGGHLGSDVGFSTDDTNII